MFTGCCYKYSLQLREADSSTAPSTSESATFTNVAEPQTLNDDELLAEIDPYSKTNVSRKRPNKRRCKSAIITDTPEKEKLVSRCKKVPQKRPERTVSSSSKSNISMHLLSDSTSENKSSTSTISATTSSRGFVECHIKIGDFAVVKVFSAEGKHKNFIGKIRNGPGEDGGYEVNFMKQSEKIKHGFQFPEKVDIASVLLNDIVKLLLKPTSVAPTKQLCGVFKFACNLSFYGL